MNIGTLEQAVDEMKKNGVQDYTQDGKCSSCGQCCSNALPMSKKEAVRILEYVKRKHIQECRHIPPTVGPVQDWTCPVPGQRAENLHDLRGAAGGLP